MKIALVTDDGASISAHFGRARAYLVLTVEDGAITAREVRPKSAPHLDGGERHRDDGGSHTGPAATARHDAMLAPIEDCEALVARGMGRGAYERVVSVGIRPFITDQQDPDAAALACAGGGLPSLVERLH
jgi:predicted Fe-Mo cluster-binding NifX family protein